MSVDLDPADIEYLERLVERELREARGHYEALRAEMLTIDRAVHDAEKALRPRIEITPLVRQLVTATNAAEAARARLRRAEGMREKLK